MNDFIGVGNYFYENADHSIDLGTCRSQEDIDRAVASVDVGNRIGWEVQPSQDLLRAVYAATVIYTTGDTV